MSAPAAFGRHLSRVPWLRLPLKRPPSLRDGPRFRRYALLPTYRRRFSRRASDYTAGIEIFGRVGLVPFDYMQDDVHFNID